MQWARGEGRFRFDSFEVDVSAAELRRHGNKIPIQDKPLRLLAYLAERSGQVVPRREIQEFLWQPDTTVVFEDGLNTAVKKLREALSDNPEKPRYIETVRHRGYRFLVTVEPFRSAPASLPAPVSIFPAIPAAAPPASAPPLDAHPHRSHRLAYRFLFAALLLLAPSTAIVWRRSHPQPGPAHAILLATVEDDANQANGAAVDRLLRQDAAQFGFATPSDSEIADDLKQMMLPAGAALRGGTALDLCQREDLPLLIEPVLVRDGARSLLLVRAIACADDSVLLQSQYDVSGSGEAAAAAGALRDLSNQLSNRWNTLPKPAIHIIGGTTASMEALRAFSVAEHLRVQGNNMEAIASFQHALMLDPGFALATAKLSSIYGNLGEINTQRKLLIAAVAQRDKVTEIERLYIDNNYYEFVAHDAAQCEAVLRLFQQLSPEAPVVPVRLSISLAHDGQFQQALPYALQAVAGWPNNGRGYVVLGEIQLDLGRPDQTITTVRSALQHGYDEAALDDLLLRSAIVRNDDRDIDSIATQWRATDMEPFATAALARIRMQQGRMQEAASLVQQAVTDLRANGMNENAQNLLLEFEAAQVLRAQFSGQRPIPSATTPITLDSEQSAIALALAGRIPEAQAMVHRMEALAPAYQRIRDVTAAVVDAAALLDRHQPRQALDRLDSCRNYAHARLECTWLAGLSQLALHDDGAALDSFKQLQQWRGADAYSILPVLARQQIARLAPAR
jgi:DNA-binding winged helix-turn-helix (wHTH) protein/tetratricopeptide (TPR) repeat protein